MRWGGVKDLVNPESKPAPPTPEDNSVVWFGHHFSEDTANAVKISVVTLCSGLCLGYFGKLMKKHWFEEKIFANLKTKDIRGNIPKVIQNLHLSAMDDVD
jgi:hypothetical protein